MPTNQPRPKLPNVLGSGLGPDPDHLCDLGLVFNLGAFFSPWVKMQTVVPTRGITWESI